MQNSLSPDLQDKTSETQQLVDVVAMSATQLRNELRKLGQTASSKDTVLTMRKRLIMFIRERERERGKNKEKDKEKENQRDQVRRKNEIENEMETNYQSQEKK